MKIDEKTAITCICFLVDLFKILIDIMAHLFTIILVHLAKFFVVVFINKYDINFCLKNTTRSTLSG